MYTCIGTPHGTLEIVCTIFTCQLKINFKKGKMCFVDERD
jgi:hypothetical protein